jgi:hypothetical protein
MRLFVGDMSRSDKELESLISWNNIEKRDKDERFWAFKPTSVSLLLAPKKILIFDEKTMVQLNTATSFTWMPTKHYNNVVDFLTDKLRVKCETGPKVENKPTVVC